MNKTAVIMILISTFLFSSGLPYEYRIEPPLNSAPIPIAYDEPAPNIPPLREVPKQWQSLFQCTSAEADLPHEILAAIAWAESGFESSAVSPPRNDGNLDKGMFQFNSRYQSWYEIKYNAGKTFDPMKPEQAVRIAAFHLKWLHERYGNWPDAVMAYNCGCGAMDKGEIPDSTRNYLIKIYKDVQGGYDNAVE